MAIADPFLSNEEALNTSQRNVSHLKRILDAPGISANKGHFGLLPGYREMVEQKRPA
jgi:hypothetical protein